MTGDAFCCSPPLGSAALLFEGLSPLLRQRQTILRLRELSTGFR